MIRAASLAAGLAALGVSASVHAALLLLPMGSPVTSTETASVIAPAIAIERLEVPQVLESVVAPAATQVPSYPNVRVPRLERPVATPSPSPPGQASPASATEDATPRFTIAIGAAPDADGSVSPTGSASSTGHEGQGQPLPEALVDGRASFLFGPSPSYPDAARAKGIEGDVRLELVVGAAGAVESARVVEGVDRTLDEAALQAAQRFRFAPATKSGQPVRVRMLWSIEFRLR